MFIIYRTKLGQIELASHGRILAETSDFEVPWYQNATALKPEGYTSVTERMNTRLRSGHRKLMFYQLLHIS